MTTFVVEAVHRVGGRPWIFLTGSLSGGQLSKGDTLRAQDTTVQVMAVEFHAPPGKLTIAIEESFADKVSVGSTLTAIIGP